MTHEGSLAYYPPNLVVPAGRRTDRLWLRPLRASDVDLDYDAVMSSVAMLRAWSQSDWPADEFTRAENLDDLQRHEREHEAREAFTFTVLEPGGARCLGCVYLTPLWPGQEPLRDGATLATNVAFWVRASQLANGLDAHLLAALREWLDAEWAFDRVVFTLRRQDPRQAELLVEAGLELRLTFALPDGRLCASFL